MVLVYPIYNKCLRASFRDVMLDVSTGLSSSRATTSNGHWTTWKVFCQQVALDPLTHAYSDPIPILQTFAREYRVGNIASNHEPVISCTVEDAVVSIGQAISAMGVPYSCLTQQGKIYVRLRFQYCAYSRAGPPPKRVKPVPIQVLRHIA